MSSIDSPISLPVELTCPVISEQEIRLQSVQGALTFALDPSVISTSEVTLERGKRFSGLSPEICPTTLTFSNVLLLISRDPMGKKDLAGSGSWILGRSFPEFLATLEGDGSPS
ncbi:hypothetical protein V6N13_048061 [Hibiscus sabdariffa]